MTDPAMLRLLKAETQTDLRALDGLGRELEPALGRLSAPDVTQREVDAMITRSA